MIRYQPQKIEAKWQKIWQKTRLYDIDLKRAKKPYYNLMMFPYPSAEGLHVGNMYAFCGSDIWGRFMKMKGFAVFEPIGLDGFGIHSENYALKVNRHPKIQAQISEKNFYRQLKMIGNMFSWAHKLETYDSNYYKWTQWIFIQLFKAGLAYRKKAAVNWCPSCKTVLADEQVINSACERCNTKVCQKELEQWFFRITRYADRLLENTYKIDWSEKVLIAQRNWIGKKEGIVIDYQVVESNSKPVLDKNKKPLILSCFTTRPDTNFGATFVVLAPEHPQIGQIVSKEYKKAVSSYCQRVIKKSKSERIAEGSSKTGVFTGRYCLNQLNGKLLPIWVSDFVLMEFGTGAVVGVPGHDKRDFQFAKAFNLEIIRVVVGPDNDKSPIVKEEQVQEEAGTMINSGFLNGMDIKKAIPKMMAYLQKKGWGRKTTSYHLRDWLISRQRYWGPPIPMIYCRHCAKKGNSWFTTKEGKKFIKNCKLKIKNSFGQMAGWYPVKESQLPVLLPEVKNWKPKGTVRGPLDQLLNWKKIKCPFCQKEAVRETDVSDTFLDSAWYFLRYPSVGASTAKKQAWDKELTKKWLPVDRYTGGAEHSVLHLLYSRFLCMVFKDLGLLDFSAKGGLADEPFMQFRAHGLIIKDGAKMSKSKGNIVNPDEYIKKYGADALRCYLMFLGPFKAGGDFRDSGMVGMYKFLARVWKICQKNFQSQISNLKSSEKELFWIHQTIKKVTSGIKRLKYNTSISALMEYVNFLEEQNQASKLAVKTLILLIAPFAPHLAEELWQNLNKNRNFSKTNSVHSQFWPKYNEKYLKQEKLEIVVQINGKVRDRILVEPEKGEKQAIISTLAQRSAKVQAYLKGKKIKKEIFIKGKLINFVV